MRTAFIEQLTVEAQTNERVFLMVGDLGYSVVEAFAERFPDRFINAGVAEQNMVGVAAGLAAEGYHVFVYSIANFPVLRCFEQIRNDVAYHRLPVSIVAVGAGLAYGNLGYSHHGVQDLAVMQSLPEMSIFSPADPNETRACVKRVIMSPGPSYIRLGKAGERQLHSNPIPDDGLVAIHRPSSATVAIVCTGSILSVAIDALERVGEKSQSIAVYSLPVFPNAGVGKWSRLDGYNAVLAVEEHVRHGGLADLLRRSLPSSTTVYSLALNPDAAGAVGTQGYLRERSGLTPEALIAKLKQLW